MGRRTIALFATFSILMLVMLTGVQMLIPVKAEQTITIVSGWLTQAVNLDGKITTDEEWSDADPSDLFLSNGLGHWLSARVWIKNDLVWLYILMSLEWPADDVDGPDHGQIGYGWKYGEDTGMMFFNGHTEDTCAVNGEPCQDEGASPPGENNVEGGASYDGTHYWFEFRKELDSGDGCDWVFVPGQTYQGKEGGWLNIGLFDVSEEKGYWKDIILQLAPVLPSIEITKPEQDAITSVSQVSFAASISGHMSSVTLTVKDERGDVYWKHDMEFNEVTGQYIATLTLADGTYMWHVSAEGVLGDVVDLPERNLIVDTTDPTVMILSPVPGEIIENDMVDVSWESGDATSGIAKVEVELDAFDWVDATGKSSYTFTGLVKGSYEVRVAVTDKAGNTAEAIRTFNALPPPWYITYWYIPVISVVAIVAIVAIKVSGKMPPKPPPEVKVKPPSEIPPKPPAKPPVKKEVLLLQELEEIYRSGKITEAAYRRLKKRYEAEADSEEGTK